MGLQQHCEAQGTFGAFEVIGLKVLEEAPKEVPLQD